MSKARSDLLQGTLDLLVLKVLSLEPMHGWGISERIQQWSGDVFLLNQGSLYPALQRMKRRGWITSEWRVTENNRRARYYALTPAGERQLGEERQAWTRSSTAVERLLQTAV
ncbi:MAG TPA: PadR family transcriptional regulator [Longimicrobiales bacterium]|nr:PadR family transcriptional regulator [Longimicrobiales bacterium]